MAENIEHGMIRRLTFFCIDRQRHTRRSEVIDIQPKEIVVFGQPVKGWLVTVEEPAVDNIISLDESMESDAVLHDPE